MKSSRSSDVTTLRRLRTKVLATQKRSTTHITQLAPQNAPLTVIPLRPPFDDDTTPKLYAIRDAFKDIVIKTQKRRPVSCNRKLSGSVGDHERVPSLASLCATVVGAKMEQDRESEENSSEDDLDPLSPIYEAVPVQYRRCASSRLSFRGLTRSRWTLLSHALSIVLDGCDHHPTLLSILLDVALEYHLLYQSTVLLRALLVASVTPLHQGEPALCHPAHSGFLIELRNRWTSADRLESEFLNALSVVLEDAHCSASWCSKAVARLIKDQCRRDPVLLSDVAFTAINYIAQPKLHYTARTYKRSEPARDGVQTYSIVDKRLTVWISSVFTLLFSATESHVSIYRPVLSFLSLRRQLDIHYRPGTCLSDDLTGALVCTATLLLFACNSSLEQADIQILVDFLVEIKPTTKTYSLWIESTFGLATPAAILDCKSRVQSFARFLGLFGFLRLEASLWACALRHVDAGLLSICGSQEVKIYHDELMGLVDDAEQRCCRSLTNVDDDSDKANEWNWEPLVGTWIRKSTERRSSYRVSTRPPENAKGCGPLTRSLSRKKRRLESGRDFTCVLSNACSNRQILHPKGAKTAIECPSDELPSSDDALNLFAHSF